MNRDSRDRRESMQSQQRAHTSLPITKVRFLHRPCKGITKEKIPCAMPAKQDGWCRMHRP